MKKIIASVLVSIGVIGAAVVPASASSGCASWGCGTANGWWYGTVTDILTDGHCVEVWTYSRTTGAKKVYGATSCGAVVSWSIPATGSDDGIRIYRTGTGNYLTIA